MISIHNATKLPQPFVVGYDEIAKYINSVVPADSKEIIFYDGNDYGSFVLSLRKYDVNRRIFVFRTSKMFFASNLLVQYGKHSLLISKDNFIEFFKKYNIRIIIASYLHSNEIAEVNELRRTLEDKNIFDNILNFHILRENNFPSGIVKTYFLKNYQPRKIETEIEIHMLTIGRIIKVNLGL